MLSSGEARAEMPFVSREGWQGFPFCSVLLCIEFCCLSCFSYNNLTNLVYIEKTCSWKLETNTLSPSGQVEGRLLTLAPPATYDSDRKGRPWA